MYSTGDRSAVQVIYCYGDLVPRHRELHTEDTGTSRSAEEGRGGYVEGGEGGICGRRGRRDMWKEGKGGCMWKELRLICLL